jgi:hypothetical protein
MGFFKAAITSLIWRKPLPGAARACQHRWGTPGKCIQLCWRHHSCSTGDVLFEWSLQHAAGWHCEQLSLPVAVQLVACSGYMMSPVTQCWLHSAASGALVVCCEQQKCDLPFTVCCDSAQPAEHVAEHQLRWLTRTHALCRDAGTLEPTGRTPTTWQACSPAAASSQQPLGSAAATGGWLWC